MDYISYAESIRRLKAVYDNEPVVFIGGLTLNHSEYSLD